MEEKETTKEMDNNAVSKGKVPTWKKFLLILPGINRSSYILRLVAGGYVAYMSITNLMNLSSMEADDAKRIAVLSGTLLICAAHFVFSAAYALLKHEYE